MKKILVVDDQQSNLITITASIEHFFSDYKILQAKSGKEGIELAQSQQPDTILLDIVMPEMDGFEVCKHLKENTLTKHIPVIMISAVKMDTQSRIKGLEAGADAFLIKPVDPGELMVQLKVMLRIKAAEDKLRNEKKHLEQIVQQRTQTIKEKEEKYRKDLTLSQAILESSENIIVFALDKTYCYMAYTNSHQKTMKKLWGVDIKVGMNMLELILNEDDRQKAKRNFDRALKGESFILTEKYGETSLSKTYYEDYYSPVFDATGNIMGVSVYVIDVTKRKQVEKELIIKEKEYYNLFDKMGDAVFVTKLGGEDAGRILEVNKAATLQTGYSREELLKKNITDDIVIGLSKISARDKMEETLNRGEIITVIEKKKKKDGKVMWAEVTLAPYQFRGEKAVIGINRDITQRKEDEENLKATLQKLTISEERFRELTDLLPQVVYETDFDGNVTFVNKYGLSAFGYSTDNIKNGLNFMQVIAPEERDHVRENVKQYLHGNTEVDTEYAILDKAGNKIPVQIYSNPIYKDGKIVGFRGIVIDITKQKNIEKALRESEQQYRIIFNSATDVMLIFDNKGNIIEANAQASKMYGYRHEELLKMTGKDIVHPDYQHLFKKFLQDVENANEFHVESVDIRKDGSPVNIDVKGSRFNIHGRLYFLAVIRDITDKIQARERLEKINRQLMATEQQLRELNQELNTKNYDLKLSSERYEALITVSHTGTWEYHADTDFLWRSDECFKMLGRNREDFDFSGTPNLKEVWADLLHPDDRDKAIKYFRDFIKNGSQGMYENYYRLQHNDGHWIWILSRGNTLRDENGNVTNITLGTHIDITEQKELEEKLKTRMEELEIFNDAAVNRELMINDLRREVNRLLHQLGEEPKYEVVE